MVIHALAPWGKLASVHFLRLFSRPSARPLAQPQPQRRGGRFRPGRRAERPAADHRSPQRRQLRLRERRMHPPPPLRLPFRPRPSASQPGSGRTSGS